ncbi:MAG: hypothetical protein FWB81_02430, partial [Cystobacterineae bacterium]|nr:hypothetical protein [Cystobacterineae bacterium]
MKLGMRSKLFLVVVALLVVSFLVADTYLSRVLDADLTARIRDDLLVRLNFLEKEASVFEADFGAKTEWKLLADDLSRRGEGRITILLKDGSLLCDSEIDASDIAQAETHADRQEVKQAFSSGQGFSVRWSSTLKQRMIYMAVPFQRGGGVVGAIRFAKPL